MRKNIAFLVSGFLVLIVGIHVVVVGYLAIPQDKEWMVNYSFPGGRLENRGQPCMKNYTIGGVYSMKYSRGDIIRVTDYDPAYINGYYGDRPIDLYLIFTNKYSFILEVNSLINVHESRGHSFVSDYDGEIKIYLGSLLLPDELQEKGYYRDWNVTFRLRNYPSVLDITKGINPNWLPPISVIGAVMILAGIAVTTFSLTKVVKNKKETRVSKK